jgi:hypothetical protein
VCGDISIRAVFVTDYMSQRCQASLTLSFRHGEHAYSFMAASGMAAKNALMVSGSRFQIVSIGCQKSGETKGGIKSICAICERRVGR